GDQRGDGDASRSRCRRSNRRRAIASERAGANQRYAKNSAQEPRAAALKHGARMVELCKIGVKLTRVHLSRDANMNQQPTLLSRIGSLFSRKSNRSTGENGDPSLEIGAPPSHMAHSSHGSQIIEPRSTFLRPWARRDAA